MQRCRSNSQILEIVIHAKSIITKMWGSLSTAPAYCQLFTALLLLLLEANPGVVVLAAGRGAGDAAVSSGSRGEATVQALAVHGALSADPERVVAGGVGVGRDCKDSEILAEERDVGFRRFLELVSLIGDLAGAGGRGRAIGGDKASNDVGVGVGSADQGKVNACRASGVAIEQVAEVGGVAGAGGRTIGGEHTLFADLEGNLGGGVSLGGCDGGGFVGADTALHQVGDGDGGDDRDDGDDDHELNQCETFSHLLHGTLLGTKRNNVRSSRVNKRML